MLIDRYNEDGFSISFDVAYTVFKKETEYWLDKFGMHDWEVYIDCKNQPGYYAHFDINWEGKMVQIDISNAPETVWTEERAKQTAFHEVFEVLLFEQKHIMDTIKDEDARLEALEANRHELIHRLMPICMTAKDAGH